MPKEEIIIEPIASGLANVYLGDYSNKVGKAKFHPGVRPIAWVVECAVDGSCAVKDRPTLEQAADELVNHIYTKHIPHEKLGTCDYHDVGPGSDHPFRDDCCYWVPNP